MSLLCCKSYTHAANNKFQPSACSSCFKQYFFLLLGGENIHNYSIKSKLPVLTILLNPLRVLVALKIPRDILSFTRSFMINTRPPVRCLGNSDRKVKQFRVISRIASSRLVLLFFDTMSYDLNESGSAT